MARIIVIRGVKDCGKTTAGRMAYNTVLPTARIVVKKSDQTYGEVFGAVLNINGVIVGFISQGDNAAILERHFRELLRIWDCEVIVCASRSRGGTVEYLEGLEQQGHTVEWIEKERVAAIRYDEANRETADEVVEALNRTVAEVRQERRAARELATV